MNLRSLSAALALAVSLTAAQAGGFGGPPPFTSGSPLLSGIDGRYQAVASGNNLSGIITFIITDGIQTSSAFDNSWIFFIDGNILSGAASVNISGGKINGILDAGASDIDISPGDVVVIPGDAAAGRFNGTIDLNSPVAAFSGKGVLSGTPPRIDQIVYIWQGNIDFTDLPDDFSPVFVQPILIPGSSFPDTSFKVRGTRLSVISASGTSS